MAWEEFLLGSLVWGLVWSTFGTKNIINMKGGGGILGIRVKPMIRVFLEIVLKGLGKHEGF